MHTLFSTRLTRAAIKAARPARRHLVRALRHHSARTRALAEHLRDARAVGGIRTWFHTFFTALRATSGSRRLSLRTLLRKPTPLRAIAMRRAAANAGGPVTPTTPGASNPASPAGEPRIASRRPRRTGATSSGWFAFAVR